MNSKQSSRINMFVAVLAVLHSDKYHALWSSKVALARAVTDLETQVEQINECAQCQETRDGAADEKAQTIQALGDAAFEIAAATKSCAVATGNKFLAGQVNFSRSEISKGRDSSVLARCRAIHTAATDVVGSLADYEVTPAKLTALKKKIEAFDGVQSKPRQATASSSAATKELTKLFQQATEVLTDRVDGLMVAFKTSEPVFFSEYEAARVTLRTGRRSGSNVSEVEVEAAPVETPVAKAA
jgi:hypothetical protein